MRKFYHKTTSYTRLLGISLSVILVASVISVASPPSRADAFWGNCANIAVKNFHAAALEDPILGKREKATPAKNVAWSYVSESLTYMKMHGINAVRVPIYWEAYINNPSVFLQEAELVAKIANNKGMCVVFSNFHYHTSSYWGLNGGRGFPSIVVDDFAKKSNYIQTAGPFWNAFLSNNIWVEGKRVWDFQWTSYLSKVINKVKGYNSVAGFEILNEPHLFNKGMYDNLGNYHTFMAKKIRSITDKKIFFDRETAWGFQRDPSQEHKIVPDGVGKLVYAPQLYAVPTPGSNGMKQIENFKTWSQQWGTEVFICEWGAQDQDDVEAFLTAFKANGFGWAVYSWRNSGSSGLGVSLYQSDSVPPTSALQTLVAAVEAVY